MTLQQAQLWQSIQNFQLDDPGADFTFSERLARENGWTAAYTARVITEYKKFIFLCCISPGGVTPSDAVDQAWHLHLTFTQSYWTGLCQNVLGRQIHHNPTRGGKAEAAKYNHYYTDASRLYTQTFNTAPPADIWPDNQTRFTDIHFRRVNTSRYWLLPKPRIGSRQAIQLMLIIAAAFCIRASEAPVFQALLIGAIIVIVIAGYRSNGKNNKNGGSTNGDDGGCGTGNDNHTGHHADSGGHSGCGSGCSGCSASGCSGCGGGD